MVATYDRGTFYSHPTYDLCFKVFVKNKSALLLLRFGLQFQLFIVRVSYFLLSLFLLSNF
jgi:hypothetical protein